MKFIRWLEEKFFFKLAIALLIVCAVLLGYFFYVFTFPTDGFKIKKVHPLSSKTYVAGSTMTISVDYCKDNDGNITNDIEFVDTVIIPSFTTTRFFEAGCHTYIYRIAVPLVTHPGQYYVSFIGTYKINKFQTDTVDFRTETFEITVDADLLSRIQSLEDKLSISSRSASLLPLDQRVNRIETQIQQPQNVAGQAAQPQPVNQNVTVQNSQPAQTQANPTPQPTPQPTPTPGIIKGILDIIL